MLGLIGVIIAPISVVAMLPIVLAVPVLKTTAMVGACALGFGGLIGPTGILIETTLIWCFLLNYLLPLRKVRAYGKVLPCENKRLTYVAAAQLDLGTIILLVLVATHVLITITPTGPAKMYAQPPQ